MKKNLLGLVMCLVFMLAVVPVASATAPTIGLNEVKIVSKEDGVVSYEFTAPESREYTFRLVRVIPPAQMTATLTLYDSQNQLLATRAATGISIITLKMTAGEVVRIDASTTNYKAGLTVS